MRCLLPALLLCACQTRREVTLPNGTHYVDSGHLAGNTTVAIKPDGTVVMHNKMNEPWKDLMQLIGAIAVADSAAAVAKSGISASKAVDLKAQSASVQKASIKAGVQEAKISADIEKTRILHPETLPVTP